MKQTITFAVKRSYLRMVAFEDSGRPVVRKRLSQFDAQRFDCVLSSVCGCKHYVNRYLVRIVRRGAARTFVASRNEV